MPKRIFIKDGGLSASIPTPTGYTVIGADGGIAKKQIESTISDIARPYRVYTALLTQSGTASPVATVLENTIGNIVWTRVGVGSYQGTLVGAFTRDKSICPPYSSNFNDVGNSSIFLPLSSNGNPQLGWVNAYFGGTNNEDYLEIDTYDMSGLVEWSSIIGAVGNLPIEIRVYN